MALFLIMLGRSRSPGKSLSAFFPYQAHPGFLHLNNWPFGLNFLCQPRFSQDFLF
jgi:hypothetical protein